MDFHIGAGCVDLVCLFANTVKYIRDFLNIRGGGMWEGGEDSVLDGFLQPLRVVTQCLELSTLGFYSSL